MCLVVYQIFSPRFSLAYIFIFLYSVGLKDLLEILMKCFNFIAFSTNTQSFFSTEKKPNQSCAFVLHIALSFYLCRHCFTWWNRTIIYSYKPSCLSENEDPYQKHVSPSNPRIDEQWYIVIRIFEHISQEVYLSHCSLLRKRTFKIHVRIRTI